MYFFNLQGERIDQQDIELDHFTRASPFDGDTPSTFLEWMTTMSLVTDIFSLDGDDVTADEDVRLSSEEVVSTMAAAEKVSMGMDCVQTTSDQSKSMANAALCRMEIMGPCLYCMEAGTGSNCTDCGDSVCEEED